MEIPAGMKEPKGLAQRPSALLGPVRGRVTVACGLGHPRATQMLQGERPTRYSAGKDPSSLPSSPPLLPSVWPRTSPCKPCLRGEARDPDLRALWHGGAVSARVRMSCIHMHVSRGQQLPSGSGVRAAGLAPSPLFPSRASPLSLPSSLPEAARCRWRLQGAEREPPPDAFLRAKKKFPPPAVMLVEAGERLQRIPLRSISTRQLCWKRGEDAFGILGLRRQEFLPWCLLRPREGTWQGPRQGIPRNRRFYFP